MEISPPRRLAGRRAIVGGATALGMATAMLLAPTAAHAVEATVDDATFTWGLNGYAQVGIFGPWTFKNPTGDVTLLSGSVSGGAQDEYLPGAVPATSMPASTPQKSPNAVKFSAGTGTIDLDANTGTLSWNGSYTINAYPPAFGAPDEIFVDPVLTVNADGTGTLTAGFLIGAGIDMAGEPFDAQDFGRLPIANFNAGALTLSETGVEATPAYQGVENGIESQVTNCVADGNNTGWWGSWPQEFIDALGSHTSGQSVLPHYYSTGCGGLQNNKPALPISVGYTVASEPETPSTADQNLSVTVPEVEPVDGEFLWAIDGSNDLVELGTAVLNGDHYAASGAINAIRVTDTRLAGPAWSISAQVSDFTSGDQTFSGKYLGWEPKVIEAGGDAQPGDAVASGFDSGDGLSAAAMLASADAGHGLGSALVGADLQLKLPIDATAGTYQATLTLTALS